MDEIDLENATAEDINELESRLYAQIHHEQVFVEDRHGMVNQPVVPQAPTPPTKERVVTQTRVVNNKSAQGLNNGRYWNKSLVETSPLNPLPSTSQATANRSTTALTSSQAKIPLEKIKQSPTQNKPKQQQQQQQRQVEMKGQQSPNVHEKLKKAEIQQQPQQGEKIKDAEKSAQEIVNPYNQKHSQFCSCCNNGENSPKKRQRSNKFKVQKRLQQREQRKQFKLLKQQWREEKAQQQQQAPAKGLFGKQAQKLDKLKVIKEKQEKSIGARLKRVEYLKQQRQPIETIVLSTSNDEEEEDEGKNGADNDDDDVVLVPLPPPPIIDVDDSNSEEEDEEKVMAPATAMTTAVAEIKAETCTEAPYMEENAIDASDIQLDETTMKKPSEFVIAEPARQTSVCTSPNSSVLSTDDFIGQTDRRRLNEDFENVRADDEDLLLLTSEMGTFLKPATVETQPTAATEVETAKEGNIVVEHEQVLEEEQQDSEPEFVPPTNLEAIKEKYRVEPSQFRALDVYESESDFTESGIYSKSAKTNSTAATVIRPLDSSSAEELNDVEIVEPSSSLKTKRLRKRRSSSTRDCDSVGHLSAGQIDNTDSDDSMAKSDMTYVPFIARGIAVEHVKTPVRKLTTTAARARRTSRNDDDRFLESLKSLAKGSQAAESDSDEEDNEVAHKQVPSAREIAEGALKKQARNEVKAKTKKVTGFIVDVDSDDEAEKGINNEALPSIVCDNLENVFKQIDAASKRKGTEVQFNFENNHNDDEPMPNADTPNKAVQIPSDVTSKDLRAMNEEMMRFYENSWGGESFNLAQCLRSMDKRRQLWRIQPEDRFPRAKARNNMKCLNCCEFGHVRAKCQQPKKPVVCHTCGCVGHQETRCPKSMCLGCGAKTSLFVRSCNNCSFQRRLICPLCKVRGHSINTCPDKWRRYHSTTQMNVPLDSSVSYKHKKYCSICGGEGHLSETCRAAPRFMDYPTMVSTIKSHEKVYNDRGGTSEALPNESPHLPFHFNWSPELERNGYYNRFLKAVGLSKMNKRKLPTKKKDKTLQAKKSRMIEDAYVQNPYAQKSNKRAICVLTTLPNQVPEISESGNKDLTELNENDDETIIIFDKDSETNTFNAEEFQVIDEVGEDTEPEAASREQDEKEDENENETEQTNSIDGFKEPMSFSPKSALSLAASHIDSDSNYSFSDHFELPTSTTSSHDDVTPKSSPAPRNNRKPGPMDNLPDIISLSSNEPSSPAIRPVRKSRPMDDLPEMIPLDSGNDSRWAASNDDNAPLCTGISMCFAGEEPLSYEDIDDVASEAKIFMQRSDTEYLFSPEGRQFLNDISKDCNVDVQMKLTSCGYVLVVYGLPRNQTKLHNAVLSRCKDVRNKSIDFHSQKPPKRFDALIRFMRDGICQLLSNLGNADEHFKHMTFSENQNTKNGAKAADKKRRLLNMILIGQAGLLNGNMHLDELLSVLRKLIQDNRIDDVVPLPLRCEIEKHWRVIFTAYVHTDYQQLLQFYHQLPTKNRVLSLRLEPELLGQKTPNTPLTEEQRTRLNSNTTPTKSNISAANNNNNTSTPLTSQRKTPVQNNARPAAGEILPPPLMSTQKTPLRNVNSNRVTPLRLNTSTLPTITTSFTTPRRGGNNTPVNQPTTTFAAPRDLINNRQRMSTGSMPNARRQTPNNPTPPFANPQRRSAANLQLNALLPQYGNSGEALLNALNTPRPTNTNTNTNVFNHAQQGSMFWSREALRYVDECLRLTDQPLTLTRLQRVQLKCRSGNLSYNDYLAVIKLYDILAGSQF